MNLNIINLLKIEKNIHILYNADKISDFSIHKLYTD
jgi:hypothetical protein